MHCLAASRAIRRQRSSFRSALSPGVRSERTLTIGTTSEQPISAAFSRMASNFLASTRHAASRTRVRGGFGLLGPQHVERRPLLPHARDAGQRPPAAAVEEPDRLPLADPGRPGQVAVLLGLEHDAGRALGEAGNEELVGGHASRRLIGRCSSAGGRRSCRPTRRSRRAARPACRAGPSAPSTGSRGS